MEQNLACNNLRCRSQLTDQALVTTCSHIFCPSCAGKLGLVEQGGSRRSSCPACEAHFSSQDDAIVISLNPSENYKTSVLSGLSPSIIMECAGRALSFWSYQTSQDMYFQQHLCRRLEQKCASLNTQMGRERSDARSKVEELIGKIASLTAEQETLRRENEELADTCREKSRQLLQTKELYDKVKRKAEMSQLERAASNVVDSRLVEQPGVGHSAMPNFQCAEKNRPPQRQGPVNTGTSMNRAFPTHPSHDMGRWSNSSVTLEHGGGPEAQYMPRQSHALDSPYTHHHDLPAPSAGMQRQRPGTATARQLIPAQMTELGQARGRLAGVGLSNGLRTSQPVHLSPLNVPAPPPGMRR